MEFLSYVSNIPVTNDYLADLYKRRWGIETQYSTVHRFQGKTCSKNENVRIFIFILGFVLLCLWLFLNAILNRNVPVTMLYDNLELVVKISANDKLVMTGKQFRRRMLKVLNSLEKDW